MDSVISKQYTFDAAHMLPLHSGKCRNLHGHTYTVQVSVRGKIQDNGMVMDFGLISGIVKPIIEEYDHAFIVGYWNDPKDMGLAKLLGLCASRGWKIKHINYPHTTAENIGYAIRTETILGLGNFYGWSDTKLMVSVTVWETPNSFAETDWEYV